MGNRISGWWCVSRYVCVCVLGVIVKKGPGAPLQVAAPARSLVGGGAAEACRASQLRGSSALLGTQA